MPGLTSTGFEKKTLAEIKVEVEAAFRGVFGIFINLLPGSVFATIIGIFAEREAELWDVAEEVYNSQYPDTAEGNNLDNAVGFNGITRLQATESIQRDQFLFGDVGTVVPPGTTLAVDGNPQAQFLTQNSVTLVAGANSKQLIAFSAVPDAGTFRVTHRGVQSAAIAYNALAAAVQIALRAVPFMEEVLVTGNFTAGFEVEFAGLQGLQPQDDLVVVSALTQTATPVTMTVTETQVGEEQGKTDCIADLTGPIDAPIGTLTEIVTPVSGLNGTLNMTETTLGRNRETDAELRIRRRNTITVAGNASVEAIRSRLLNLEGVRNVFIFENETLVIDGDSRPGKSYEVVIDGGDDDEIASAIWLSKPAGIQTFGSTEVAVIDTQGVSRAIFFSRPDDIRIYLSLDITKDSTFPSDGSALARAALLAWVASIGIGTDVVVYPRLVAQLDFIPGILDLKIRINTTAVNTTPGATAVDDNVAIAAFEVASLANADLNINIL